MGFGMRIFLASQSGREHVATLEAGTDRQHALGLGSNFWTDRQDINKGLM
jgi:hypothetical protein